MLIICFHNTFLEWDTDDVLQWLDSQGLQAFKSGFRGKAFFCLLSRVLSHDCLIFG